MTPSQASRLIEAEALVEEGRSDIFSGRHLTNRKASVLDPNEDLQAIHERGREMIAEGERKIAEGERKIAALVDELTAQRARAQAELARNYTIRIQALPFKDALLGAAQATLSTCRQAGYDTLLYDNVFLTRNADTEAAQADLRTKVYNTLVEIDGLEFSVRLLIDLSVETEGDNYRYVYSNRNLSEQGKVALLQLELIAAEDLGEALLVVSAVDTETHHLIDRNLYQISDSGQALTKFFNPGVEMEAKTTEEDDAEVGGTYSDKTVDPFAGDAGTSQPSSPNTSQPPSADTGQLPARLELTDRRNFLGTLEQSVTSYRFTVQARIGDQSPRHLAVKACLTTLLLRNTQAELQDDAFVRRAYLARNDDDGDIPEDLSRPQENAAKVGQSPPIEEISRLAAPLSESANAVFLLLQNDNSSDYRLEAVEREKNRRVTVGPARIHFGVGAAVENADSKEADD